MYQVQYEEGDKPNKERGRKFFRPLSVLWGIGKFT